jgi:AAHS family 4-hydroxybenzoate transporter-like MFS transporter
MMKKTINVSQVIDTQPIGAFQVRVFMLCAAVLFVDGFDVQAITYVAPAISQEWGLTRGALGPTFSAGLFGVMLGAILLAPLADRIGRRRVIILSCAAFGLGTLLTMWVASLNTLLLLRFFTGFGLGSALPNAIGLASEYAPERRRALVVMFVGSGISIGSIASGVAAAQLVNTLGWRALFVAGGVLPLLLAIVLLRVLPESLRFAALLAQGDDEARRLLQRIRPEIECGEDIRMVSSDGHGGKAVVADLFRDGRGPATITLWVAFFMSLLNVYLAINWLPTSLNASGFTVPQAAFMTSLYHFGGVAGTYAIGLLMDRLGPHRMVLVALLLALIGFSTFAGATEMMQWPTAAVLMLAGFGVIGAQVGLTALSAITYPVSIRSTGLGWGLGIGRIGSIIGPSVGGWLLATAANPRSVYAVCVVPVVIGMAAVALLMKYSRPRATARIIAMQKEQVQ